MKEARVQAIGSAFRVEYFIDDKPATRTVAAGVAVHDEFVSTWCYFFRVALAREGWAVRFLT